ncbi:tetratricopeptide repeat protein [Azospirillum sp.]|uniref:tetratricopeptide repeat protein n=1 Tax=Azospirillum sp. TaxID=34012 RepID=UPI003D73A070
MGFGANGHRRAGGLLAVSLLLAAAGADAASVPVRGAVHKDYARLVFDWPQKVTFSARVEGERLVVSFDQPIEAAMDKAVAALSSYVAGGRVGADGKSVEFDLKRPVTVRAFRGNGNGVALDLTPASAAAAAAAAAKAEPPKPEPAKADPAKAEAAALEPAKPAASLTPVAAPAAVKLRAADQPTHSRMVFDWTAPVEYTVQRDGSSVTMLFDKAAQADLSPVAKAKLRNIGNLEQFKAPNGGLAVTFAAPPDADLREYRTGNSVIVDILNPGTRKTEPAQTAAAPQPPAPAQPASPPPAQSPAPAQAAPAAQPPMQPVTAAPAKPVEREKGPILVFDAGGPAAAAVYPRAGYLYVVFDKPLPIGAGTVTGPGAEQVGTVEPVPATGGSAFRTRIGPFIWPQVERQGTVWRIVPMTRLTAPLAEELRVDSEPDFLLGARIVVRALDAANVVQLTDPEVGDRLHVVPLPRPGQAINETRRYPDLEVLPSFQGIAVRPINDALTVRPVKEGVELTSAGGLFLSPAADLGSRATVAQTPPSPMPAPPAAPAQGGASPSLAPPPGKAAPILSNKRLFDPEGWQRGGPEKYTDNRQALQQAIVEAPESERPRAQLDLARFYFANGMGAEAQGMMDVLQATQPDLEGWPEFRALRGAARMLYGDLDGAAEDLAHPALADNAEAGLWRAAVAAGRNQWQPAARGFKAGAAILTRYPEPLLSKLATLATEAALQSGDTGEAKRLLDRMEARIGPEADERPDIQYLRGELARQQGDLDRAHDALEKSYDSLDRYHRAKAGLALVNLELEQGKTSPAAAAERLAGLTFIWRGDDMEMAIRQRLGEVQVAAGNFAEGFNTMKETAALIGDGPRAEQITKDMARIFADLYKDGASRMPTLEALKLYDQFRELTPVGPAGDEIIRQLAERLIQIDMLERAADLLQYQTEYRLSGADKAYVGTRLATVRLLDNKPAEALKALEISNVPDMPADLAAERRLMQAKALDQLGRGEEALALLAQDDTRESNLLRVDMAWRAQKWGHAAVALGKVIGQPPAPGQTLEPERSQLVLNRAVALALAGDGTGLAQLRKEFGGGMEKGADADAFRVLTRPEQATGLIDVNTIRSRVAEVDVFQKFLKGYKGRMANGKPNS